MSDVSSVAGRIPSESTYKKNYDIITACLNEGILNKSAHCVQTVRILTGAYSLFLINDYDYLKLILMDVFILVQQKFIVESCF